MTVRSFAGLLPTVLLAFSSLSSASAPNKIDGKYCGVAWSGGELVEVVTRFETRADGLLVGSYDFADFGETTSGTLREYLKQSDDKRTLIWVDKYGTGQLVIRFDENRSSFTGHWGVYIETPTFPWNGKRCEAPIA
jgi:hypothetical protein